jgi:hypothetical protein
MTTADDSASMADVDTIAPVNIHTAEGSASSPNKYLSSHPDERQSRTTEVLHLDEGDTNVRTKFRTLAIVSALYFVLFIAALDQTIIA